MHAIGSAAPAGAAIGVAWCCACASALASSIACGGVGWAPGALRWRAARLNLAAGVRAMLSREALSQTLSSACACVAVLSCALPAARTAIEGVAAARAPDGLLALAGAVVTPFWWRAAAVMTIVAAVDVVLARRRHDQRLRMTPREVREERAEHEGRPETKARRRSIGLRRVRRLRVAALKRAAVVVANPTHVAIALEYAPPAIDVPVVSAAGAGSGAAIVRAAAAFYDVPVVESPELARSLYASVDVDEPVPEELYAAIAAIFAWILKTRGRLGPPLERELRP